MLRLIQNELTRIFTSRYLLGAILILLCLNLGFALRYRVDKYIPNQAYRRISNDLVRYADENGADAMRGYLQEKVAEYTIYETLMWGETPDADGSDHTAAYLQRYQEQTYELLYTNHISWELLVYQSQLNQAEAVGGYPDYLEQIRKNADRIQSASIFADPDSFAYRNSVKAEAATGRMADIRPVYDVSYGIVSATDTHITDLTLLSLILLITVYLLIGQKSTGLQTTIRSCKNGRGRLIWAQMAALLLICLVGTGIFIGINLGIGAAQFGLGDLSRPIQSVEGFLGCTLRVSVLGYLALFWLEKSLALFAAALVVSFLCMAAKSDAFVFLSIGLLTAAEAILFYVISPFSYLSGLKYLNLASAIQTNGVLKKYANFNFFSIPFDLRTATLVTIGAVILIFGALTIWLYAKGDTPNWSSGKLSELLIRLNPFKRRIPVHLWYHEAYKIMITNKAVWILLAFVLIQFYHYSTYRRPYDLDDTYFREYVRQVDGMSAQEAWVFAEAEQARFDGIHHDMFALTQQRSARELGETQYTQAVAALQSRLAPENALSLLVQRLEYLDQHCPEGAVVYDTGYNLLYHISPQTFDQPILAALFLALCISPILAFDRERAACGMIRATRFGRTKARYFQWLYACLIGAAVLCIAYLPLLINVSRTYGLGVLSSPVQSLPSLAAFPFRVSLGGFLLLLYALRLLTAWLGVYLLMQVSGRCRSVIASLIIGLLAVGVPLGIYLAVCLA